MAGRQPGLLVEVGDIIADKYRVERVIGTGGMGVVVAAVHVDLGETRAIKLLLPESSSDPSVVERFMREARAVARLRNAHVARVYDVGRLPGGEPYIVMEHLTGLDLRELMKRRGGPLGVEEGASHVMQALEGVAEAHAGGIVHRDLKLANLFLTDDVDGSPCIKVLDFGISKVGADLALGSHEMTETASLLGTPLYMSPEQMRSAKDVDRRSDIWSLGVILYKLLTGRLPFGGDSITAVCLDVVEHEPVPPSTFNPRIPAEVDTIVLRCLAKNRDDRYQNALELAAALAAFAGPHAQTSLSRINRWHHAPPPASLTTGAAPPPGLVDGPTRGNQSSPLQSGQGVAAQAVKEPGGATFTGAANTLNPVEPRKSRVGRMVGVGLVVAALGGGGIFIGRLTSSTRDRDAPAAAPTDTSAAAPVGSAVALAPPEAPVVAEPTAPTSATASAAASAMPSWPASRPAKPEPSTEPSSTPEKPNCEGDNALIFRNMKYTVRPECR